MTNPIYLHYERKEPSLALILSLFITGTGQMYCGRIGRGVFFLIFAIIGWAFFFIPGLAIWIYGMIDAYNLAQEINEQNEKRIHEQENIRLKKEKEQLVELKEKIVRIEDFREKLSKNDKLFKNELIDTNEYIIRKKKILDELSTKKTDVSPEDFLYELLYFKENNILSAEDMQTVKTYLL